MHYIKVTVWLKFMRQIIALLYFSLQNKNMDSILLESRSATHFEQQSLSFNPNESFFPPSNEEGYVTLNEIQFDLDDLDDCERHGLE